MVETDGVHIKGGKSHADAAVQKQIACGENVTLSIDGVPQTETSIYVPETFRMRIEQYRISSSGKSTAGVVGTVLAVLESQLGK